MQLTRSRRIAIQFGEILSYIDTVSIGSRHIWPFSRPFPHHVPPQNLSCPQPKLQGGELGLCGVGGSCGDAMIFPSSAYHIGQSLCPQNRGEDHGNRRLRRELSGLPFVPSELYDPAIIRFIRRI